MNISQAERIAGLPPEQQESEVAKIIGIRKEQAHGEETAPASSSPDVGVAQAVVPSPTVLGEAVVKAALQFQAAINEGEITEPGRILQLVQQVPDIVNAVGTLVRAKHPMKTASTP